jgi:hypothetical protein
MGRLKTAEGAMEYSAPQIAGRDEPFRSAIRQHLKGHTRGLEDLAIEKLARGPAPGDLGWCSGHHQRAARQRCLAHRMRNLAAKLPEDVWPEFKVRAQAAYQAPSRAIARELAAGVIADYGRKYDNAVACFMDDFEAYIAHLRFPVTHRRAIRTKNLLERLFVGHRLGTMLVAGIKSKFLRGEFCPHFRMAGEPYQSIDRFPV